MRKLILPEGNPVGKNDRVVRAAREIVKRGIHPILIGDRAKLLPYFEGMASAAFTIVASDGEPTIRQGFEMLTHEHAIIAGLTVESDVVFSEVLRIRGNADRLTSCMYFDGGSMFEPFVVADPGMRHVRSEFTVIPAEISALIAMNAYRFMKSLGHSPAMAIVTAETCREDATPKTIYGKIAREVVEIILADYPEVAIVGPWQLDVALQPYKRPSKKVSGSRIGNTQANVVSFLSLEITNPVYKTACLFLNSLGPIICGLQDDKGRMLRASDISRGASVEEIVLLAELLTR